MTISTVQADALRRRIARLVAAERDDETKGAQRLEDMDAIEVELKDARRDIYIYINKLQEKKP